MKIIIVLALIVTMLFTGCNGYSDKKESKDDSWATSTWENSTTLYENVLTENILVENIEVEEIHVETIKIK